MKLAARIATLLVLPGLLAACTSNSGGVYACSSDSDCTGSSGGSVCINGHCGTPPVCGTGLLACGNGCVDANSDPSNCGSCGNVCAGASAVCRSGTCATSTSVTPQAVLDSPALTADANARLHLSSCDLLSQILVTTSPSTPVASDPAWSGCTTAGLAVQLSEGPNTISIWGKNPEGLVSTAPATLTATLDTTPPAITATGISDGQTAGADGVLAISITLTDSSGIALGALETSTDGANWAQVASVTNVQSGTYPLMLPLPDLIGALQVRVRAVDALGNQGITALGTLNLVEFDPNGAPFGGGTGVAGHPFRIGTTAQLANVAGQASPAYFILENDLDLTGLNTISLGYFQAGEFDGNGHTLSHFSFLPAAGTTLGDDIGLFQGIGDTAGLATSTVALVKNLTVLVNAIAGVGASNIGGLAGHLFPGGEIDNCQVQLNGAIVGLSAVGGLVGFGQGGQVIDSSVVGQGGPSNAQINCGSDQQQRNSVGACGGAIGNILAGELASGISVTNLWVTSASGNGIGGIAGNVEGSLTGSSATQTTVIGITAGGAVGNATGTLSNLQISSATVTCDTGGFCGGLVGYLSSAQAASGNLVEDSTIASSGDTAGGLAGDGDPTNGAAVLLSQSQALRTSVSSAGAVGGAAGAMSGEGLDGVIVEGQPALSGVIGVGGLVGNCGSGASFTINNSGTDARITGVPDRAAGLVGECYPQSGASIAVTGSYSRAAIAGESNATTVGAGGFFGNLDAYAGPSSLSITDSLAATSLPQGPVPPSGGIFGNLTGHGQLAVTLTRVLELELLPGQGHCIYGSSLEPTVTGSGFFWDSDLCSGTDPAGLGINGAALASEATFTAAGYVFTNSGMPGAFWTMGPASPQLASEPAGASFTPPSGSWTAPVTLGSGSQYTVSVDVTSAAGAAQALVQISLDGGITWTTIGAAGPLSSGENQISIALPEETGDAEIRVVLEDSQGDLAVLAPTQLSIVECDPTGAPFGGGLGTLASPFRICSAAQLSAIGPDQAAASGTPRGYALASDLDLTGQTIEIPSFAAGTFDGGGHQLYGFSSSSSLGAGGGMNYNFGFFDFIGSSNQTPAVVKNLTLHVLSVSAPNTLQVGALAGSLNPGAEIEDVQVILDGSSASVSASGSVGAMIGFAGAGSAVINSSVAAGGGTVSCDGTGEDTFFVNGYPLAGGLIGVVNQGAVLSDLSTNGISVTCPNGGAGGLAGYTDWNAAVSGLSVSGAKVSGLFDVGGIASTMAGPVNDVRVDSTTVTSTGDQNQGQNSCGGVAANLNSSLFGVSVSNSQISCPTAANVGGMVGLLATNAATISGTAGGASVTGTTVVGCNATGGIVGSLNQGSVIDATIDDTSLVQLFGNQDQSCIGMGGIVGWFVGGTISQTGSAATLDASSGDQWVGGIAGYVPLTNPGVVSAIIRESYARGSLGVVGVGVVGGLVGAVFGDDPDDNLSVEFSYTDLDMSTVSPEFGGGILGSVNMTLNCVGSVCNQPGTVLLNQVVAFGKGPSGACTVFPDPGVIDVLSTFWNSDLCSGGGNSAGTGIITADADSEAFFQGEGFVFPGANSQPLWQMGLIHPILEWEPAPPSAQ